MFAFLYKLQVQMNYRMLDAPLAFNKGYFLSAGRAVRAPSWAYTSSYLVIFMSVCLLVCLSQSGEAWE